jgi:hypothetical protein
MARQQVVTYPTAVMVAAALKAVEGSNGEIVKQDQSAYNSLQPGGAEVLVPAVKSTRTLMTELLTKPEDLNVAAAQEAIDFVHGAATMSVFCGKMMSDFTKKMVEKTQNETVTSLDTGFMVYFVPVYYNFKKSSERREKTVEYINSEYFGKVGEKVEIDLTVIDSKWLDKFGMFVVFGHTADGNLVNFFTAKPACTESGKYTGKVKKHEQSQWHENAKVTVLNYVKAG